MLDGSSVSAASAPHLTNKDAEELSILPLETPMVAYAQATWERIQKKLKENFGSAVYMSWFKKLILVDIEPYSKHSFRVILGASTKFVRDWVATRYAERIEELWQSEDEQFYTVSFVTYTTSSSSSPTCPAPEKAPAPVHQKEEGTTTLSCPIPVQTALVSAPLEQDVSLKSHLSEEKISNGNEQGLDMLATSLDNRFTFDSFVSGPANELALAAAKRLLTTTACFNPLFLYSNVGLGKTHLMQAMAWEKMKKNPTYNVVYLSAEKFMYHFVHALRTRTMFTFKQQLRAADMFMVDDIQFISGKETTQDEFFQTFNALIDQNKQIVLSADKCPMDFEDMAERVRSRLNGGLVVDIGAYDAAMRLAILKRKIALGHVGEDAHVIGEDILALLAEKISSNIRELEGALKRLAAYASIMKTKITPEVVHEVLKDLIKAQEKRIDIDSIQVCVAAYYGIALESLLSRQRDKTLVKARHMAIYFSKIKTNASLSEIGKKFGGREHGTIIHAIHNIEQRMKTNEENIWTDFEKIRPLL